MKYTLIWELLQLVDKFERQQPDAGKQTLSEFIAWLLRQGNPVAETPGSQWQEPASTGISRLLFFGQRYALVYMRQVLEGTPLTTIDDFTYLITLLYRPGLTKIQLIEDHIHGKTTGMEIIRRLLSAGFIRQQDSEVDKRSRLLFITAAGEGLVKQLVGKLVQVGEVVVGDLNEQEQAYLLYMLTRLHQYHNPIYRGGPAEVERVLKEKGVL
ncbi:hypothetical protein GCM10023189_27180 [Nibrella saemangeumensis]|uniref:HTH marR-type domain-containing protein n=1 Tax=Nibrella saemangeumensis TaxID=1084526 RepID=A0ABP8MYT9_9BACT